MSLLEVLVSIGVLTVGLLGFALLIPVGRFQVSQAAQSDFAGQCGRQALRDVKIRRIFSPYPWPTPNNTAPHWLIRSGNNWVDAAPTVLGMPVPPTPGAGFMAIDPLGVARGLPQSLGPLPRVTLRSVVSQNLTPWTLDQADAVFTCRDDVSLAYPGLGNVPGDLSQRPFGQFTHPANAPASIYEPANGAPAFVGQYTWFLTAMPSLSEATGQLNVNERIRYLVSVVVCNGRVFSSPQGNQEIDGVRTATIPGNVWSGAVQMKTITPPAGAANLVKAKHNEWIMLCCQQNRQAKWYRVIAAGDLVFEADGNYSQLLTLSGPDWDPNPNFQHQAVIIPGVIGVYTAPVEIDRDPVWSKW